MNMRGRAYTHVRELSSWEQITYHPINSTKGKQGEVLLLSVRSFLSPSKYSQRWGTAFQSFRGLGKAWVIALPKLLPSILVISTSLKNSVFVSEAQEETFYSVLAPSRSICLPKCNFAYLRTLPLEKPAWEVQ